MTGHLAAVAVVVDLLGARPVAAGPASSTPEPVALGWRWCPRCRRPYAWEIAGGRVWCPWCSWSYPLAGTSRALLRRRRPALPAPDPMEDDI